MATAGLYCRVYYTSSVAGSKGTNSIQVAGGHDALRSAAAAKGGRFAGSNECSKSNIGTNGDGLTKDAKSVG